jgi:tetratricopeptide (TPR) repeat protein
MPEPLVPSSFDDLIDRALRGEKIDPDAFLRANPELTELERRQVRELCGAGAAPAAADDVPPPIDKVGPYRLAERLGVGSTGAVFLAEDETLGRRVAVKILGPDVLGTGERADRFLREVRAAARLRHPNIVTVHAAGEQDGVRYMAMELLPGAGLDVVIARAAAQGSRPPVAAVLRWGIELARALQAAHEAGIMHRDVKPSNVRIADDGRAVLLDFGLARDATDATLTEPGSFRGSPQYASPEQVEAGRVPIGARSDLYSLAATLYEVLTGVAPCRGETREQLFHNILTRDPVPLRRLDPDLPRDLETVILASLQKDPARRHATAAALAEDLEAVRDGRPVSVRPPSPLGRAVRWARRNPAKAALLIAVLGLVVAAVAIVSMSGFIRTNLPKIEKADADEKARRLDALVAEGFLEYGEGDRAVARAIFQEAMRLAPESVEAKAGHALASQPDAASTRPAPPSDASPHEHFIAGVILLEETHRNEGNAAAEAAFAKKAYESLRQAVLSSKDAKAAYHYELGHAAWHAGEHAAAREIASAIARLWPESETRSFAIGRTLLDADREAALSALEKAARKPPRAFQARCLIALKLAEFGLSPERLARAGVLARGLVADFPNTSRAHGTLGVVLLADGKVDAAIPALSEAVRLDPGGADALRVLAQAYLRAGRLTDAVASAREATRLAPDVSQSWSMLGLALSKAGALDESIDSFERAVELNPRSADAVVQLGTGLLTRGDLGPALERLKQADEIGSKDPGWKPRLARVIAQAERLVAMEKAITAGLGEGPEAPADPSARLRLRDQAQTWFEEDLAEAERGVAREPSRGIQATASIRSWASSAGGRRARSVVAEDVMTSDELSRWRELWTRYDGLIRRIEVTRPVSR